MKNMKKLAGLMLALIMALALTVPAFAAQEKGTITIKNAAVGDSYKLVYLFDVTYAADNEEAFSYSGNVPEALKDYFAKDDTTGAITATDKAKDTTNPKDLSSEAVAAITEWAQGQTGVETKEATSGTVTFENLTPGYYVVVSSNSAGAAISVTTTHPNAEIIAKNQEPGGIEKKAVAGVTTVGDAKSAQIGDVVDFEITYTTANYDGDEQIVEYYVNDDMPDGFDLVADSIKVYVGPTDGTDYTTPTTNYVITYPSSSDPDDFKVTIDWTKADGTSAYPNPYSIKVTYKAKMNENAVIDGAGNTNTAEVTHKNVGKDQPEPGKETDKATETVYTYALAIKKIDEEQNPLAGAVFNLKNGNETVKVVGYGNGVYKVDPNGSENIVSPETGVIIVTGVENISYTLEEITPPDGYNKLEGPVTDITPVVIGKEITATNTTKYLDAEGNIVAEETESTVTVVEITDLDELIEKMATGIHEVINYTGSLLPDTGGIGTTIFYTVGGILVVGAAILLVTRKRMKSEM